MQFLLDNLLLIGVAVISGVLLVWPAIGRGRAGNAVDTTAATELINRQHAVLVDIRAADAYAAGHIPQARNVPVDALETRAQSLPRNKPLILVCDTGRQAGGAVKTFKAQGFENVVALEGGLAGWRGAGLPVATGK